MASAYLYSEIEPVGIVRGGVNPEVEALVYCKPEGRAFAAKVGTRFFDGELRKITSDGVLFETLAGQVFVEWGQDKDQNSLPAHKSKPQPAEIKAGTTTSSREPSEPDQILAKESKPAEDNETQPLSPITTASAATQQSDVSLNPEPLKALATPPIQMAHFIGQRDLKLFRPELAGAIPGLNHRSNSPLLMGDKFNAPGVLALKAAPSTITLLGRLRDDWKNQTKGQSPASLASSLSEKSPSPKAGTFCDLDFKGDNYNLATTRKLQLIELFEDLYDRYKVNFIVDPEIQQLPVRLSIVNAPWTTIVRALMDIYDLHAVCMDAGIIKISSRSKMAKQEDDKRKNAPMVREVFKLKYIQPQATGRLNLAGQAQNGTGGNLQSLEETIRSMLRAGGDPRGDVRRIPGRSELIVAGTEEQIREIRELIKRVDRPSYQVVIQALVYTVNDTMLRDIGTQASIIVGNGAMTSLGGVSTLPNTTSTSGSGVQTGSAGLNPGGVPGLGPRLHAAY